MYVHRNLGLCHDLLHRRNEALRPYARARMRGTGMEGREELVLHDFETWPYARGRAAEAR